MKKIIFLGIFVTLAFLVYVNNDSLYPQASVERGAALFKARCTLCHGQFGMGEGVLALAIEDYPNTNLLKARFGNDGESMRQVVLHGGSRGDMHTYSPPWADELNDAEIDSLVLFLQLLHQDAKAAKTLVGQVASDTQPNFRLGNQIYRTRCVICHGESGKGDGRMAVIVKDPPPFNLSQSQASDDYLMQIISRGGEAIGRSPRMPPWGDELSLVERQSLILYIKTLRQTH